MCLAEVQAQLLHRDLETEPATLLMVVLVHIYINSDKFVIRHTNKSISEPYFKNVPSLVEVLPDRVPVDSVYVVYLLHRPVVQL